jgi:hypothetical protein
MINTLEYNVNELNDAFINSLRHPVNHPDAYEDPDEILRMNEERLKDWRRNVAKIRGSHFLKINNTIVM